MGGLASFTYELDPKDINLWSAEKPSLYYVALTCEVEGQEQSQTDSEGIMLGFRRTEVRDGILLHNGKRLFVQGANRHEFDPDMGRVMTLEGMIKDILVLK